ncbi:MAG: hypothetical protein WD381_03335 [Balneolaceae bacterium]
MKTTVQFILPFTLLLFISSSMVFAQDSEPNHSLTEDAKALQFSITENFTLSSFEGNVFSYTWHSSDDRANRLSLGMQNWFLNETDPNADAELSRNVDIDLNLSYSRIHYTDIENDIKFYLGYGPGVHFTHHYRTSTSQDFYNTGVGVSFHGLTGVQWFFHPSISMHAEYGASLQTQFIREKRENQQGDVNRNNNSFSLSGDGVRFGLSVYF